MEPRQGRWRSVNVGTGCEGSIVSSPEAPLIPLLAALRDLMRWFEKSEVPGIVIGGVAASLLGRPRFTRDVDALVLLDPEQWKDFLEFGEQCGFAARRPDALRFASRTRLAGPPSVQWHRRGHLLWSASLLGRMRFTRKMEGGQRDSDQAADSRGSRHHESRGPSSPGSRRH